MTRDALPIILIRRTSVVDEPYYLNHELKQKIMANTTYVAFFVLLLVAVAVAITVLVTTNVTVASIGVRGSKIASPERPPRAVPIVADYFGKGWDFRARDLDNQVVVVTSRGDSFEDILFRIACAVALCAHLGYRPPLVLLEENRDPDCPMGTLVTDVPERLHDIFPNLHVLITPDPHKVAKLAFPGAMNVHGSVGRNFTGSFVEFPNLQSRTVVIDGSWESWKYSDDYQLALFHVLEFHPMLYHHCRRSFPELFDKKGPIRGIFINDRETLADVETLRRSIDRYLLYKNDSRQRSVFFVPEGAVIPPEVIPANATVFHGQASHVCMYASIFCRDVLVDLSPRGWWVASHAASRGRPVHCIPSDNVSTDHFVNPRWRVY